MKYQSKRNGEIGRVIGEVDPKYKTVMLELESGETTSICVTTLKRWWKKVEDDEEVVEEPILAEKEVISETEVEESEPIVMDIEKDVDSEATPLDIAEDLVKEKFDTDYTRNSRGILCKGFYIVGHKYGVRIYMAPVSYEKLKWFKVGLAKVTHTNNKKLPMSVAIKKENIKQALKTVFSN